MESWPEEFLLRMKTDLGDEFPAFLESLSSKAPVSIRLNPSKPTDVFDCERRIPWCRDGRYLEQRPSFTFDPLFHAGTYYVQEASSMFLESVFRQCFGEGESLNVLDLCAAPGGKSTHLLSLLSEGSLLVSNEIIPQRNKVLRQNLLKWGNPRVIVTQNETNDFLALSGFFDLVVVDAPCSGEGLFRRDPDAAKEWSPDAVAHCVKRQGKILSDAFRLLKKGGVLVYSTCTFCQCENEQQLEELLKDSSAELISLNADYDGVIKTNKGIRFYPHRIEGEGFFISAIRKTESDDFVLQKSKTTVRKPVQQDILSDFLVDASSFSTLQNENGFFAIPEDLFPLFQFMEKRFYIRQAGIRIGEMKGNQLQPSHDLALSSHLRKDRPSFDFKLEDAVRYLRCESVMCPGAAKGWTLATYKGFPLGWMKVLDGRVNNYFPKEWRVRKEYNPDLT